MSDSSLIVIYMLRYMVHEYMIITQRTVWYARLSVGYTVPWRLTQSRKSAHTNAVSKQYF